MWLWLQTVHLLRLLCMAGVSRCCSWFIDAEGKVSRCCRTCRWTATAGSIV